MSITVSHLHAAQQHLNRILQAQPQIKQLILRAQDVTAQLIEEMRSKLIPCKLLKEIIGSSKRKHVNSYLLGKFYPCLLYSEFNFSHCDNYEVVMFMLIK